MKKSELLKTEHQVQLKWLDNQIAKIAKDGAETFLNLIIAERAYKKMNDSLSISDSDIENFISVHLSERGLKKLVTTLRVYLKRNQLGTERLQVEINNSNSKRLDEIVKISGLTKRQIINQLIITADFSLFKRQDIGG